MSKIEVNQAILVRDIIDMAREYKDDANVIEYISNFCFQLGLISEECGVALKNINWCDVFSHYDERYYKLSQKGTSVVDESAVNKVYDYAVSLVEFNKDDKNE